MTHPKGGIVYQPTGVFAFPRPYIKTLHVFSNTDNVPTYAAGLITLHSINFPNIEQFVKIKDNVRQWSTTGFSLNYVIEWWYYTLTPGGTEIPYGGVVRYEYIKAIEQTCLTIQTDSPNMHTYFPLPLAPPTYYGLPELGDPL